MWKRVNAILLSLFLIVLACLSIYMGIYFYELSKPETIVLKAFSQVNDKLSNYLLNSYNIKTLDTFSLEGNIDFDLNSEKYREGAKYNKINNLSKMDTTFTLRSNKKDKVLFTSVNSNIGEESIINYKYLVENSTNYYYYGDILNQYINNGTCNYFESLTEENTAKDNLDYLGEFIIKSFALNLDEDYTKTYQKMENILGKSVKANELTIQFNNQSISKMLKAILKDLKKDERAHQILSDFYNDFDNYKIDDKEYLDKDEYYMLHIFTSDIWYEPLKYKIDHLKGDDKESFIIEIGKDKSEYYYVEDDNVKYKGDIEYHKNNIIATIKNITGHDLGEFKLDITNDSTSINCHLDDNKDKKELYYISKYVIDNGVFINEHNLEFKNIVDNQNKLSGKINLSLKLKEDVKTLEDVSNTVLVDNLSEDVKDKIKNYPDNVKNRLER